jgi:glycine cleavage system H protein
MQEGDSFKLGIDDFLSKKAGYINFLTIDRKEFETGEYFASIESGKFVSKIYAPTGGKILDVNQEIVNNPRKISEDPYGSWIVAIQPGEEMGSEDMFESEVEIQNWIEEEMKRYEEEQQS